MGRTLTEAATDSVRKRGLNRHPRAVLTISVLIAAATVIAVAVSDSPAALWRTFVHLHASWLAPAVAAELLAYGGYVLAYRAWIFAAEREHPPVTEIARLVVAGFGPSVAAGGFAFDRRALARLHLGERRAKVQVLGLGVVEYMVLAPVAAVCAAAPLLGYGRASPVLTVPWIVGVPFGFALAWGSPTGESSSASRAGTGDSGAAWRTCSPAWERCGQSHATPVAMRAPSSG
jgi:hypothetical protein